MEQKRKYFDGKGPKLRLYRADQSQARRRRLSGPGGQRHSVFSGLSQSGTSETRYKVKMGVIGTELASEAIGPEGAGARTATRLFAAADVAGADWQAARRVDPC